MLPKRFSFRGFVPGDLPLDPAGG